MTDNTDVRYAIDSEFLKQCRLLRRLTQAQLALQAGVTATAVSNLENGARTNPAIDTVARLADALEVNCEALLVRVD